MFTILNVFFRYIKHYFFLDCYRVISIHKLLTMVSSNVEIDSELVDLPFLRDNNTTFAFSCC